MIDFDRLTIPGPSRNRRKWKDYVQLGAKRERNDESISWPKEGEGFHPLNVRFGRKDTARHNRMMKKCRYRLHLFNIHSSIRPDNCYGNHVLSAQSWGLNISKRKLYITTSEFLTGFLSLTNAYNTLHAEPTDWEHSSQKSLPCNKQVMQEPTCSWQVGTNVIKCRRKSIRITWSNNLTDRKKTKHNFTSLSHTQLNLN